MFESREYNYSQQLCLYFTAISLLIMKVGMSVQQDSIESWHLYIILSGNLNMTLF